MSRRESADDGVKEDCPERPRGRASLEYASANWQTMRGDFAGEHHLRVGAVVEKLEFSDEPVRGGSLPEHTPNPVQRNTREGRANVEQDDCGHRALEKRRDVHRHERLEHIRDHAAPRQEAPPGGVDNKLGDPPERGVDRLGEELVVGVRQDGAAGVVWSSSLWTYTTKLRLNWGGGLQRSRPWYGVLEDAASRVARCSPNRVGMPSEPGLELRVCPMAWQKSSKLGGCRAEPARGGRQ